MQNDQEYVRLLWDQVWKKAKSTPLDEGVLWDDTAIVNEIAGHTKIGVATLWSFKGKKGRNYIDRTLDALARFIGSRDFIAFRASVDKQEMDRQEEEKSKAAQTAVSNTSQPTAALREFRITIENADVFFPQGGTLTITFSPTQGGVAEAIKGTFNDKGLVISNGFGGTTLFTIFVMDMELMGLVASFYKANKSALTGAKVRTGKVEMPLDDFLLLDKKEAPKQTAPGMTEAAVRNMISHLYPDSKFEAYSHTDDFMALEARIGKGFHFISLYNERIESKHIETGTDIIIASNSYLSSFAYNLALSWIYEHSENRIQDGAINPMIKYNFKKFYAEQLYHRINNVFSRAVLLETLLYEQQIMIPVFAKAKVDFEWDKTGNYISDLMSNMVLLHELGHYHLKYLPLTFDELVAEHADVLRPFLKAVSRQYPSAFTEEVKCDVFALYTSLMVNGQDLESAKTVLRGAVLGASVLAVLYSLQASAGFTAEEQWNTPDNVVLKSIEKSTSEYTFILQAAVDQESVDMIARAKLMAELCAFVATSKNIDLYGSDGILPLNENVLNYLFVYLEHIMEQEDDNTRAISRLVAEAFQDHPDGIEHLYLNSKVFKSAKKNP